MAQASSISLKQFTTAVQAAVKVAVQKHPKFKVEPPAQGIHFSYLIRGIPVSESLAATLTLGETQAFANEIAAHLGGAQPEALTGARGLGGGVVYSFGGHIIVGIPPAESVLLKE